MQAGKPLDAEISKRLFRHVVVLDSDSGEYHLIDRKGGGRLPLPPFSTDTDTCYRIVDAFKNLGYSCNIRHNTSSGELIWFVAFFVPGDEQILHYQASTVAHAVCLAALALLSSRGK